MGTDKKKLVVVLKADVLMVEAKEIDDTLHAEQALVGGYIEPVYPRTGTVLDDYCIMVNEEGSFCQLLPNIALYPEHLKESPARAGVLTGDIFITGRKDGESVSKKDIPAIVKALRSRLLDNAARQAYHGKNEI